MSWTSRKVADPSQPLGFDVVAKGRGTIDTTDLSPTLFGGPAPAFIIPSIGSILTGPASSVIRLWFLTGAKLIPPPETVDAYESEAYRL
jgi:hypothetical protein